MPVAYLISLRLSFKDGRIWEINIQEQFNESTSAEEVADKLLDIFNQYKKEISKIDFSMDIERLKKDIRDSSKHLL